MSVVTITSRLREAAGPYFTISQVKLGYEGGGKQQVLRFFVSCNKPGVAFEASTRRYVLDGGDDPVKKAVEIGQQLAKEVE